jgi:hypothetical protein
MASESGLYSVDDRVINEYGEVDGMRMAGEILGENLLQCHIVDHKSHMT